MTADEPMSLFADCAERAERLRQRGAEVVFVTGAELSLMNNGFLPGDTFDERLEALNGPHRLRELLPEVTARVDSIEIADRFAEGVRAHVALGKPVAITEFGSASYRGAGDRGARSLEIVEYDKDTGAPVLSDERSGRGHWRRWWRTAGHFAMLVRARRSSAEQRRRHGQRGHRHEHVVGRLHRGAQ